MPKGKKTTPQEPAKEPEVMKDTEALETMKDTGQTTAIVRRDEGFSAVDVQPEVVKRKLDAIRTFQDIVRKELIDGQDFGVIPGTPKPTLLKPGAEKIIKLLNLADVITIEDKVEDWEMGFFYYRVKCTLVSLMTGQTVATGIGSCNSKEDKYRWRWLAEWQLTPDQKSWVETTQPPFKVRQNQRGEFRVYRFPNEEVYTQVNTVLKMAKKRAQVDAALSVGRLSNIFTQDIEDGGVSEYTSFFDQPPGAKRGPKPKPKSGYDKGPEDPAKEEPEHAKPEPEPKKKPAPEKETHPLIELTLSNGKKVSVTQYTALDYFQAVKESLTKLSGDEAIYYATLEQFGYKHSKDIPIEKIPGIWDTLVQLWKMYKDKEKPQSKGKV